MTPCSTNMLLVFLLGLGWSCCRAPRLSCLLLTVPLLHLGLPWLLFSVSAMLWALLLVVCVIVLRLFAVGGFTDGAAIVLCPSRLLIVLGLQVVGVAVSHGLAWVFRDFLPSFLLCFDFPGGWVWWCGEVGCDRSELVLLEHLWYLRLNALLVV